MHYFFLNFLNFIFYYATCEILSGFVLNSRASLRVLFFLACMFVCSDSIFSLINVNSGYYVSLLVLTCSDIGPQHQGLSTTAELIRIFQEVRTQFLFITGDNLLQSRWCKPSVAARLPAKTIVLTGQDSCWNSMAAEERWEAETSVGMKTASRTEQEGFVCWYFVVYFKCLGNGREAHGLHGSAAYQPIGAPDQYQMAQEKKTNKLCTYIN